MFSIRWNLMMRILFGVNGCSNCGFSTSTVYLAGSYYDSLGIPRDSTQNDIKAAYYRLSKIYHPDKNQGSDEAAQKFREITQAYEVLGNYRTRRLYDKGIFHTGPTVEKPDDKPDIEDDAETKFYKSRFRRSTVENMSGRTPIYNFDEWSRAHYGNTFQRKQNAKLRYDQKQHKTAVHNTCTQYDTILFSFLVLFAGGLYMFHFVESSYDTPKPNNNIIKEIKERNGSTSD
ncbi:dnaJ homolog subfamily C member 30, mitochondrial [Teleopsis dalmanni]|uniref:dnaJ homolog subfamily C member 30, mitochondrial n=1 Tax=Teleopsis dalmanni TaxID=139649 RepID=UPI0018CE9D0D|nr:dnaJ homolog subfamily C member 30, mitochondrial [Teleopsis dalmanni]